MTWTQWTGACCTEKTTWNKKTRKDFELAKKLAFGSARFEPAGLFGSKGQKRQLVLENAAFHGNNGPFGIKDAEYKFELNEG